MGVNLLRAPQRFGDPSIPDHVPDGSRAFAQATGNLLILHVLCSKRPGDSFLCGIQQFTPAHFSREESGRGGLRKKRSAELKDSDAKIERFPLPPTRGRIKMKVD